MPTVALDRPPTSNATSEMTRLLCAGARLDDGFGKKVIDTLLTNRGRLAAPAYGYDAVPVLAHALDARYMRWMRIAVTAVCVALILVLMFSGLLGVLPAFLSCLWTAWVSIIVERLMSLQVLMTYLKSPGGFDGKFPSTDSLSRVIAEDIAAEQDTTNGVVYYGGYQPFVGAGVNVRQWSFAVLLEQADVAAGGPKHVDRCDAGRFTVDEVTDYVLKRLPAVLTTDAAADQRIERLDVTRRWYRKSVSPVRPHPSVDGPPDVPRRPSGPRLYDMAREYLCIRVGSWDDELVTSVFVSFDVKGKVLYTELYSHVLPPIEPKFRLVDQLPTTIDGELVGKVAWHATKSVLGDLIRIPLAILGSVPTLIFRIPSRGALGAEDLTRYARAVSDHGALISVRELAAISGYRHFFQEVDAEKYTTIVERRLLDLLADFLTEKGLDTGELRERQATVLNYGIIHHGTGDVVNNGTQAMGPNAQATNTAHRPGNRFKERG